MHSRLRCAAAPRLCGAACSWLLVAATSACYAPLVMPLPVPQTPAAEAPTIGEYAHLADDVIEHSNRVRSYAGAGPLRGHGALHRAAQDYALELAERGVLDHESPKPGGRTMRERLTAAGAQFSRAGENLARLTVRPERVGEDTIDMWMTSPGHRQNLLTPAFTYTGVGIAQGREGHWFVVQLYMLPAADRR